MQVHVLKCWPESFSALLSGKKKYEIRKNDRGYQVGDILRLIEWRPGSGSSFYDDEWNATTPYTDAAHETGKSAYFEVVYVTHGGRWGLPPDISVLGVEPCEKPVPHAD